jgi:hypothetical protein
MSEKLIFDLYMEFLRSGVHANEHDISRTQVEIIRHLYEKSHKKFPQRRLARIFGCSVGKMSRLLREG